MEHVSSTGLSVDKMARGELVLEMSSKGLPRCLPQEGSFWSGSAQPGSSWGRRTPSKYLLEWMVGTYRYGIVIAGVRDNKPHPLAKKNLSISPENY